ncbi:uncharacterized protein B0I36DRAFT_360073 [Microdochium trichocladiopsis]|uniref:Uncharacterized protein n=1 Tax=Microdochium trichocladiopsis TaxID=1682393 RepID=A0A9P9BSA9_9PEZI|nr:uncharacterized protein B0I36DRAFT_360073 [Microdochium trichocladiopsis]KAH7034560.1 hypothetical protein B0I36DRAFT_360073 [Microdochium trichocladiopsis]
MHDETAPVREISITVGHDAPERHDRITPGLSAVHPTSVPVPGPLPQVPPMRATEHRNSIVSIGWDSHERDGGRLPEQVVEGLDNEDLWHLLRKFNRQIFHVKATTRPLLPGDVDFDTAADEDFTAKKVRAHLERLYIGVIIDMLAFAQHIARLRSWREPRRTGIFFFMYFASWAFGLLLPATFAFLAGLVLYPPLRRVMFPSAPLSMVDPITGDLKPPPAGSMATADSATGAPEAHKGQAREDEAANFAASIMSIAVNIADDAAEPQNEGLDERRALEHHPFHSDAAALEAARAANANGGRGLKASSMARELDASSDEDDGHGHKKHAKLSVIDPQRLTTEAAAALDKADSADRPSKDKSKPVIQKVSWQATRLGTHWLGVLSDYWERCENMMNPKPPFSKSAGRHRIATVLLALCAITLCVTPRMICRSFGFVVGMVIFGQPLLSRMQEMLVENNITLRSTIFHGVPTNAQQTITLLRLGEAARAPLPPPPPSRFADLARSRSSRLSSRSASPQARGDSHQAASLDDPENLGASFNDRPLGRTPRELQSAAVDGGRHQQGGRTQGNRGSSPRDRFGAAEAHRGRLMGTLTRAFKHGAKAVAKTAIAADAARAKVLKTPSARLRLGSVEDDDDVRDAKAVGKGGLLGPVEFRARHDGHKGFVYLTTDEGHAARVCFTRGREVTLHDGDSDDDGHLPRAVGTLQPVWSLPIDEIAELNKFAGYGGKAKVAAGWALETSVKGGLQIVDRNGQPRLITAVAKGDELFNRLCAMGEQHWEIW